MTPPEKSNTVTVSLKGTDMTPVYAIIENTNMAELFGLISFRLPVEIIELHLRRSKTHEASYCKINVFYVDKGDSYQKKINIEKQNGEPLSLLASIKAVAGNNIEQYSMFFDI